MTDEASPESIEFIRLDGHAVRVTSWAADPGGGNRLVAITRGSRDAEAFDDILARPVIALELPGQDEMTVRATSIDRRAIGEGQAAIVRFAVTLEPGEKGEASEQPPPTLEMRIEALEEELAAIRNILKSYARDIADKLE